MTHSPNKELQTERIWLTPSVKQLAPSANLVALANTPTKGEENVQL